MIPLVSCLCPTMPGREGFLDRALACFAGQDYPYLEMVVICDLGMARRYGGSASRPVRMVASRAGLSLGEKRNLGVQWADGQIICHFDDDDVSQTDRVSHQVSLLRNSSKAVVGYHTITVEETRSIQVMEASGERPGARWWIMHVPGGGAAGTSLCYRKEWALRHPFPPVTGGEDDRFYTEALDAGEALAVDGEHRICATNHAGNCSKRLIGGVWWTELERSPYDTTV